ncbi:MAG: hypothetical protein MZV64_53405 [Ignavibacteriales bacterium]|nr:hypothetical protein [Ignavibacteriales bacterium]
MGFFNDSLSSDKKYFMVLNRYYSSKSNYSIKLKDLDDYYNWNLINYVDTTSTTLLTANNKTTFLDTLLKGDANLYSIAPVVKYGGLLAYNDTIKTNTTLSDNMTIDAGKSFADK